MNRYVKIVIGWLTWTIGVISYAHLGTEFVNPDGTGGENLVEFAYGAMMASYLIGVPILTGIWLAEPES